MKHSAMLYLLHEYISFNEFRHYQVTTAEVSCTTNDDGVYS